MVIQIVGKMKILSILLVLLLSFSAFSQVKYIEKETPAPYNGFLFTVKKTKEVRKELIEKDQLKIFNEALKETLKLKDEVIGKQTGQVEILKTQNEKLAKQIDNDKSLSRFQKTLWFTAGVLATSLAVYGASQLVK